MNTVEVIEHPAVYVCFTGRPEVTCAQVNAALKNYAVVAWNWCSVDGRVELSCLMVLQSEVRKLQLAAATFAGMRQ